MYGAKTKVAVQLCFADAECYFPDATRYSGENRFDRYPCFSSSDQRLKQTLFARREFEIISHTTSVVKAYLGMLNASPLAIWTAKKK